MYKEVWDGNAKHYEFGGYSRMHLSDESYAAQLKLYKKETRQHARWLAIRRAGPVFISLLISFTASFLAVFLLTKSMNWPLILLLTPALTLTTSFLAIQKIKSSKIEKLYYEQKVRNKKMLDDWHNNT